LAEKDTISDFTGIDRELIRYREENQYIGEFAELKNKELDTIIRQETNIYIDDKTFAPVRNLVAGVNKLVDRFENN
jgi:hypothetical protein